MRIDGSSVTFAGVFRTQMACMPDTIMAAEHAYLAAFEQVDTFAVDGDTLTLTGTDTELVYERVPQPEAAPLVGTTWVLDTVLEGSGPDGTASTPLTDGLTFQLHEDGSFFADTSCAALSGPYTLDGDRLVVEVGHDDVGCEEAAEREAALVGAVFGADPVLAVDGQRLRVTGDGQGLEYHARP